MINESNSETDRILETLTALAQKFTDSALCIYRPDGDYFALIDRLMTLYLDAQPNERRKIIEAFKGRYGQLNMLVGYAHEIAEHIRKTGDASGLRAALAATSIEEALGRVDYRDRLLALAELFVAAEEAGIDPSPDFEQICGLAGFSEYAVVASRRGNGRPFVE